MKYSILIPAYKQQFLSEAIESCLRQTVDDYEVIIVNDCSPADLDAIVRHYNDPRIKYFKNEKNNGAVDVVDNWNKCLSYASGDYVICMGDDDRLLPNCLEEYGCLIEKFPDLDVYHARTELIDEEGHFMGLQEARPEWESALSALWHQCCCHRIQYIGDFLFRTSTLRQEGGFYKLPLAIFSDNISSIRAAKNKGVANTQKISFQYRVNKNTITSNGNPRILAKSIKLAYDWFLVFLEDSQCDDTDSKFRKLLLNGGLRNHMYLMMLEVVSRDLNSVGTSAIDYWMGQYDALGITEQEIMTTINNWHQSHYGICYNIKQKCYALRAKLGIRTRLRIIVNWFMR